MGYWRAFTPRPKRQHAKGWLLRVERAMHHHIPTRVAVAFPTMTMLGVPVSEFLAPKIENGGRRGVSNYKDLFRGHGHHHRFEDAIKLSGRWLCQRDGLNFGTSSQYGLLGLSLGAQWQGRR